MTTFIHVRNRKEGKCLTGNGEWSQGVTFARVFDTAKQAANYCRTEKLKGVEILILRPGLPPLCLPVGGK